MSRLTIVLTGIVAALLPLPAAAQITVGSFVRMLETSEGRGSMEITVRNDGDEVLDIEVDVRDWAVDSLGNHTFHPAGTMAWSCGTSLRTGSRELRVGPRASAVLGVTYEAPTGAPDTRCRNIIFFRITDPALAVGGDRLVISTGVKVYVGPPDGS
jgi:hypothetical protein